MNAQNLSLRQRQLISILQHAEGYMTGDALAKRLNTTSRTVRNDIRELNELLRDENVQIISKHRFGYRLSAEDPDSLKSLIRAAESFISRPERLRHIILRLCLTEEALDLDEFADEMYISKTTLEHDLVSLRTDYLLKSPWIQMTRSKNRISFEHDERKRRAMLCRLYADSWDYNGRDNLFFQYEFLEKEDVDLCIEMTGKTLAAFHLRIEDANMVYLDLAAAIAVRRVSDGHFLSARPGRQLFITDTGARAADALLDDLGAAFSCEFSEIERKDIAELISCSTLPDMDELRASGVAACFSAPLIRFANQYLSRIREAYHLDFIEDEDFYLTLLQYLRYLELPVYHLNHPRESPDVLLRKYCIEFELAFSIEPLALKFYGSYLNFEELLYLSFIFSGALVRMPFPRLRTVIFSQFNTPAAWNLRTQAEDAFSHFLYVTALLPMHAKDTFDFRNTDLVLITARKNLDVPEKTRVLTISPWFDSHDHEAVENCIMEKRFSLLYGQAFPPAAELLDRADWHEHVNETDLFNLLTSMGQRMIDKGYADMDYLTDLLHRSSLTAFALQPSYIVVHSSVPARKTHIEVVTLEHRIRLQGFKIRTVFMLCMAPGDNGLIFKLYNELYQRIPDPNETRFFKTKAEWLTYLSA